MQAVAADRTRARQARLVVATLLLGYAAFYLCRANFDAAMPLLMKQYGVSKAMLGAIASLSVLAYAVGKLVFGVVGDHIGGRRVMLLAILGSATCALVVGTIVSNWLFDATPNNPRDADYTPIYGVFAVATGWLPFTVMICASRFFQSGGWGGVVHVVSRWFPAEKHGAVMGAISTSYELGNVITLLFCGFVLHLGFGWRALYVFNPLILLGVGVLIAIFLRGAPYDAKIARGHETYRDEAVVADKRVPLRDALPWLVKKPSLWIAVALSVLLTFVRTGMMTWLPTFLFEIAAKKEADAGAVASAKSAIFSGAGIVGALIAGKWSDRYGPGRRAPVMVLSLLLLTVALLALAHTGVTDLRAAMVGAGACGLFLLGPYSLLGGAITLDVAGTKAASTAAGMVDGFGYVGASLAGIVIGKVAQAHGWSAAFDVVAAVSAMAMIVALAWWKLAPKAPRPSAA